MKCPRGSLLSGLTLSMSNLQTWPESGSSPSAKSRIPFTVCITCKAINSAIHNKVYQVCLSQGDTTLMVSQFFECTANDFLQTFFKNESQTNAYFSCLSTEENGKDIQPAVYEAKFPAPKSGVNTGIAKQNWQDLKLDFDCENSVLDEQFICGLHIQISKDNYEENMTGNETYGQKKLYKALPHLTEICCQVGDSSGPPNADFFQTECDVALNSSLRTSLIVIATFFAISLLILIACAAHIAGFSLFLPRPKPSVHPTKYESQENGNERKTSSIGTPVANSSVNPTD